MDGPAAPDLPTACPDDGCLAAYAVGRLGPVDASAVENHLAGCPSCTSAIERRQEADSLLAVVQSLPPGQVRPAVDPARPPAELVGHPRYRLDGLIGRGGMGVVWRATHLLMNRPVAVKVVHPDLARSPAAVARFRREVEAAARLDHPHIVRTFDAEQVGGQHLLVMELVDGPDLARVVADRGPLPAGEAVGYARQVCLGLQHAHDRGMVHRDIKPQNLLLAPDGTVKVADFGLAFVLTAGPDEAAPHASTAPGGPHTRLGDGCGTPDYIAPEQVRDAGAADIRSDLYSLGCTLYHLLAGRPPFAGGSGYSKVAGHLERTPPAIALIRPDLPPALLATIDTLLAKNPVDRFQTPRAAADALAAALTDPPTPARRWTRRRLMVAGTSTGVLAGVGWWGSARQRVPYAREVGRFVGHEGSVHSVALSPDERTVLSAAEDGTARLWSLADGREVQRFTGHTDWVGWAEFMPDGRRVLTASYDGAMRLFDADTGAELRRYEGADNPVIVLAVSADGTQLLSGGPVVLLWDAAADRPVRRLGGLTRGAQCVRFLPGGRAIGCGDGRAVAVWELATGRVVRLLDGHSHAVDDVAMSADGRRALAVCRDKTARLWSLDDGRELARYEFPHRAYRALSGSDRFQVVCNDEQTGLSVSATDPQQELFRLVGHTGAVWGVAFSADRRTAVTGGVDRAVRVWRLPG